MSQVSGSFTVVVNPATSASPLTLNPASGTLPAETEGVADAGDVVTTVSGGVPPYSYSDIAGLPPGMELTEVPSADGVSGDVDIVISGTPTAGDAANSPYSISFTVTDSAAATASFKAGKAAPAPKKKLA